MNTKLQFYIEQLRALGGRAFWAPWGLWQGWHGGRLGGMETSNMPKMRLGMPKMGLGLWRHHLVWCWKGGWGRWLPGWGLKAIIATFNHITCRLFGHDWHEELEKTGKLCSACCMERR